MVWAFRLVPKRRQVTALQDGLRASEAARRFGVLRLVAALDRAAAQCYPKELRWCKSSAAGTRPESNAMHILNHSLPGCLALYLLIVPAWAQEQNRLLASDWRPAGADCHAVDREVAWHGRPGLKIWQPGKPGADGEGCRWHQPVKVKPGRVYTLCAQAKSKLRDGAVGFEICFYQSLEQAQKAAFTPKSKYAGLLTGVADWTFIAYTFEVPADVGYASISCRGKQFTGEAWFSDLHLLEGESLPVPIVAEPPDIDGQARETEWKNALVCRSFTPLDRVPDESPHRETQCLVVFDESNLYFAAVCPEPAPDKIRQKGVVDDHASIADDDGVDLILSRAPDYGDPRYCFAFTAHGRHAAFPPSDAGWRPKGIEAAARIGEDQYVIEARIPFSDLASSHESAPQAQAGWKLALLRRRYVTGRKEVSCWSRNALEVRRPWTWTPIRPSVSAPSLSISYGHWERESSAFRGIRNYGLFASEPLYGELVSRQPRRHPGRSGFIWRFAFSPAAQEIALRFGMAHDSEALMRQCKDAGLAVYEYWLGTLDNSQYVKKDEIQQTLDRSGAKVCYYAAYHQTTYRNKLMDSPGCPRKQDRGRQLIFDPAVEACALADLKRTIESNRGRLRSVMLGDEVFVIQLQIWPAFLRAWHRGEMPYPWLDKAMAELKENYGYGEFGPPGGPDRDDEYEPFRRIAFKRWFADQTVRVCKNFSETARKLNPDLLVIGPDISFHRFARHYAYSRYEPHLDVLSGQLTNFWMKVVGDLIGDVDLWPCNHRERWGTSNETIAYFSENIMHGSAGFNIWPRGSVSFRGKSILHNSMYWDHRPRWDTHLQVADRLQSMPRLRLPEPDAAILFSNITDDTNRSYTFVDDALYQLLGPKSGTWFRYVSDYQIEDGKADLSKYKAVFVPQAKYGLKCVADALSDYVRDGGRLVVCDPEAFSYLPDGTEHHEFRENVAGVALTGKNRAASRNFRLTISGEGKAWLGGEVGRVLELRDFPVDQPAFSIKAAKSTRALAEYGDGTPAIALNQYGKGQCLYFAFQPCMKQATENREWVFMFRHLARALGMKANHDIWRFQMPLVADDRKESKTLDCLTGNHLSFYMHEVIGLEHNVSVDGMRYRYSVAPDLMSDSGMGDGEWIPFAKGDLTDRTDNLTPGKQPKPKKGEEKHPWAVAYGEGKTFGITLDMGEPCQVQKVGITYQGHLPSITVTGSTDNTTWDPMGSSEAAFTRYVRVRERALEPRSVRYVKLEAAKTEGELTVSEVELWGKAAAGRSRRSFGASGGKEQVYAAPRRVEYPESVRDIPAERLLYLMDLEPKNEPKPGWLPAGKKWAGMNGRVTLMSALEHKGGIAYDKSLYAQTPTEIVYGIPEGCTTFAAAAGLGNNDRRASVVFKVLVDGVNKFQSPIYRAGKPVLPVVVDVRGGKELRLIVEDGGDGIYYDYAWWGEARLIR